MSVRKTPKKRQGKALWVSCFKDQAKALRPENSKAGGVRVRSTPEAIRTEAYLAVKELYLHKNPMCGFCKGVPAVAIHHRYGRQGWLLVNVKTWLGVCDSCHRWIHKNPDKARGFKVLAPIGGWNKTT